MSEDVKYCKRCWNMLQFSGVSLLMICNFCGDRISLSEEGIARFKKVYHGKPGTFGTRRDPRLDHNAYSSSGATVDETCPSCGAKELSFKTAQLRSADEGQAIFYHCSKCGYRSTLNT